MRFIWIIIVFFSASIIHSCTKEIEFELPVPDESLVVYSMFHPDSIWQVSVSCLTQVEGYTYRSLYVENAVVDLFENNEKIETLSNTTNGNYISSLGSKPKHGNLYHIRVSAEGYPTAVSAQEILPEAAEIDSLIVYDNIDASLYTNFYPEDLALFSEYAISFKLAFTSRQEGSYQKVATVSNYTEVVWAYATVTELQYNIIPLLQESLIKTDKQSNNHELLFFSCTLGPETCEYLDSMDIVLFTYNESYYKYIESLYLQERDMQNAFLSPTNLYSNIQYGQGIFSGYTTDECEVNFLK